MIKFECKRCGACCQGESTVSLSDKEIERIANFLHLTIEEFIQKYILFKGNKRKEMRTKDGYCIFFDKRERICKIHPVKPERCKEWPFPPIIFKDKENFLILQNSCEGLKDISFENLNQIKT
ncbi:MAG: YkgJ family cysteine cluster protein [Caldimicrobium sp.]